MAQRHLWVDSGNSNSGSGTQIDPYRTLAAAAAGALAASGDINHLHIKSRSLFNEVVPTALSNASGLGLYIDIYGGSDPATIDITTSHPISGWTYNPTFDWYTKTIGTNTFGDVASRFTMGILLEDGVPLTMYMYTSNQVALRARLEGGGYACNWLDGVCYMVPSGPGHSNYRASTHHFILTCGAPGFFTADTLRWNKKFSGLRLVGSKAHGSALNTDRVLYEDCEFFGHGGRQISDTLLLGNGIECGQNTSNVIVRRCKFVHIFDSGVTAQTYGTPQTNNDILFEDNEFIGNGLSGIEVSTQSGSDASTSVRNVVARRNTIRDAYKSFASAIYEGRYAGIGVINNSVGSIVDRVSFIDNTMINVNKAITVTESGTHIKVIGNRVSGADIGIYLTTRNAGPVTTPLFDNNELERCRVGIQAKQTTDNGTSTFQNNRINFTEIAYEDISATNAPVVLFKNELNAKIPVQSVRTEGLTGSNNTTTGDVDPTFAYLFE